MPLLLRASATPRAFNCPGSVLMEQLVPPVPDSDDSREGTAAHEVADMVMKGVITLAEEMIDRKTSNGVIVTGDMANHVQGYIDFLRQPGLPVNTETPVRFEFGSYNIEGTCDANSFDQPKGILRVADLKYGYRIVEAEGNWQTTSYGIGLAMKLLQVPGVKINEVHLTVYQPRPFHAEGEARTEVVTFQELNERAEKGRQISDVINGPNPPVQTGSHCKYCPALHTCPAAQQAGMNAVDVAGSAIPQVLSGEALASEMITMRRAKDMLQNRIDALSDIAINRIKDGAGVPGWGLEPSTGKSTWTVDAETLKLMTGINLIDEKLCTPAEAKRRGVPEELVKSLTERPFRGWKLTEVDLTKKAKGLFNDG